MLHFDAGAEGKALRVAQHRALAAAGNHHVLDAAPEQRLDGPPAILFRHDGEAHQIGPFVLVGRNIGEVGQMLIRYRRRGRGVEHHGHAGRVRVGGHQLVDLKRNLVLQHHHIVIFDVFLQEGDLFGADQHIGRGDDHDAVLRALLVFLNLDVADGGAAFIRHHHVADVDAMLFERGQHAAAKIIVAHLAKHIHLSAQQGRLHRLVGALAARGGGKILPQDGFTGVDEAARADDQIHHKAADDQYSCLFHRFYHTFRM